MIVDDKIQTKKKATTTNIWYGNPNIELIEGVIVYSRIYYQLNKNTEREYNENELESVKQFIWESNIKNNLILSPELCCINVPNKISINEFMSTITIYLSYISVIRVLKSPIPNYFYIYLQFKTTEYANIFYNTFNYSKISPIEKDYLIFTEVKEIKFEEIYRNELSYQNRKKFYGIKTLVSPSNKNPTFNKFGSFYDDNFVGVSNKEHNMNLEKEANKMKINSVVEELVYTGTVDKCSPKEKLQNHIPTINPISIKTNQSNKINNSPSLTSSVNFSQSSEDAHVCSICLDQIDQSSIQDIKCQSEFESNQHTNLNNNPSNHNHLTSITGIIYVLCGHVFHIECFLKLDDDKCPLCRFTLSPASISSCSLCTCEEDLWMCLVCGSINCGEEGRSNNHRKEHYLDSGHIYAKGIGDSHNTTFDFTKNAPLHIWFQNSISSNEFSNDSDALKDPKEKVEYIMSEYNSIISSQLESQRTYYISLMKKLEDSGKDEELKIDNEIQKYQTELSLLNEDLNSTSESKNSIFEQVKQKELLIKQLEKELNLTEEEYKTLLDRKDKFEQKKKEIEYETIRKLQSLEEEIEDLQNQIKDLKIHMKTLNKVGSNGIAGASIEFLLDTGDGQNKRGKKKK